MAQASWNSLEIAKLAAALLTPLLVAGFGFWLNGRLKSLELAQWSRQKIIERRIRAYDELAPSLNQLYCFFCYVGRWKELEPPGLIELKRDLDQTAHVAAPLFDREFLSTYNDFMELCFAAFGQWGDDAKLRTLTDRRRQALGSNWDSAWELSFAAREAASEPAQVKAAYATLMAYLARAIGAVEVDNHLFRETKIPGNFEHRAAGMVSRTMPDGASAPKAPDC